MWAYRGSNWRLRSIFTILGVIALSMGVLGSAPTAAQEPSGYISVQYYYNFGNDAAQPTVVAGGWTLDEVVQLTVSDGTGVVFETSAVMEPAPPWGPPFPTVAIFDMGEFWVQRGQTLTVAGGFVQSIVASDLRIDEIDYDSDVVRVSGASGGLLQAQGPDGLLCDQADTSNPDGTWVADFAGCYDIILGSYVIIVDLFTGGMTSVETNPYDGPAIQVVPVGDYLDLIRFAPGPVTVTVNGTALDPAPDGGSGDERVGLADYGIDLKGGDVVIASQSGAIAEVTTVDVEITAADPTTGVVSGLAPDGVLVNVATWTDNGSAERVTTSTNGAFSVNFSIQGGPDDPEPNIVTLSPGSGLAAFVYDVPHTGDASKHDWQVPNPRVFEGFFQPIDTFAINLAKAGQTVPVRWQLTDGFGEPISDPATFVALQSRWVACDGITTDVSEEIEEYASGGSGLIYDDLGYWQFNWKTPKMYADTCRGMWVQFDDGSRSPEVAFDFR